MLDGEDSAENYFSDEDDHESLEQIDEKQRAIDL